ncbi:MAG: histidine triad (HIT) protein [Spirochaetes bacterium]|nr:MAG: histidine triad (HIT) protein [Spirochaetota bacterium]
MNYFLNFEKLSYVKGEKPLGCILCLIRDKSPDVIDLSVYEDKLFIVTVNLYPYNPGHLLIFPRRHIEDIREYNNEEERKLVILQRSFLDILDEMNKPFGYNIGYNMKLSAGASIRHLHLHIIPRYPNETGIADLIAGKRVLVESPFKTAEKLKKMVSEKFLK